MKNTIMTAKSWRYTQFWQQLYLHFLSTIAAAEKSDSKCDLQTAAADAVKAADLAYIQAFKETAAIEMKDIPKLARAFIRKETLATIEASRKDDPE